MTDILPLRNPPSMPRNGNELQQETNRESFAKSNFCSKRKMVKRIGMASGGNAFCWVLLVAGAALAGGEAQIGRDISKFRREVQRMRQAILKAAASGDIEQLRVPIDMNELPPVFANEHLPDPIAYFKAVSGDGNGREILAILYSLLTTGYAVISPGTDKEMIVWPYHAAVPLNALAPSQEVELYRFLPPARFKEMLARGKYSFYSIGIGRDGVWHYFMSGYVSPMRRGLRLRSCCT